MKRLIIVGSPRSNGRSAHLAEMLFEACIDECPEDELYLAPVSELDIAGCVACDACKRAGEAAAQAKLAGGDAAQAADAGDGAVGEADGELPPIAYCPRFDDDMLELYDVLAQADELVIVSPVFFSGAPAGLTALLDRLQPYFWEWLALRAAGEGGAALAARKRPATLHVIGEGLDKNGYVALVSKVRSAIAPAGFRLTRVLDWVGKIDADGTIQGEAEELAVALLGTPLVARDAYLRPMGEDASEQILPDGGRSQKIAEASFGSACDGDGDRGEEASSDASARRADAARPKLDLSGGNRKGGNRRDGGAKHAGGKSGRDRGAAGKSGAARGAAGRSGGARPGAGKGGSPKKNGKRRG